MVLKRVATSSPVDPTAVPIQDVCSRSGKQAAAEHVPSVPQVYQLPVCVIANSLLLGGNFGTEPYEAPAKSGEAVWVGGRGRHQLEILRFRVMLNSLSPQPFQERVRRSSQRREMKRRKVLLRPIAAQPRFPEESYHMNN